MSAPGPIDRAVHRPDPEELEIAAWLKHYAAQDTEWRIARLEAEVERLKNRYQSIDRGWGKRLNELRIRLDNQFETLARRAWQTVEEIKAKYQ